MGIDECLAQFVQGHRVPAVAVAVVGVDGEVECRVAGVRRRGSSDVALALDRWHIGSCTKTFTAVLWACLIERGEAVWDMPVPEAVAHLGGGIHPDWAGQTIDSVLHCRAGLEANLSPDQMRQSWMDPRPLAEQRKDIARHALSVPPDRPGRFVYSNLGYIVVGAAIDALTGTAFEQALADRVLKPLGIDTAGFGPPDEVWGHPARLRLGHIGALAGPAADPSDPHSDNPAALSSAGTMHITMADWAKFVSVFLQSGPSLLEPGTVDHLLQMPPGRTAGMAMGWNKPPYMKGVAYAMQGFNTLWSAAALIDDERRRAALVACNDGRTRVLNDTPRLAASLLF